jgi:hypothetical protein
VGTANKSKTAGAAKIRFTTKPQITFLPKLLCPHQQYIVPVLVIFKKPGARYTQSFPFIRVPDKIPVPGHGILIQHQYQLPILGFFFTTKSCYMSSTLPVPVYFYE